MRTTDSPSNAHLPAQAFGQESAVGFIGLGVMGRPMAGWLLRTLWRLHVYARREPRARPLVAAGARRAATPRALGRACRVVMLCLPDDDAVEQVLFGADGLAAGLAPGSVVVDMSTIAAGSARRFAERLAPGGRTYLDAPISGGQQGAEAGTLACMIGGPARAVDAVRELLGAFCRGVTHVGAVGAGQTIKACNQVAAACALLGVAEAAALARSQGVDAATMREVLLAGTAHSFVLEKDGLRILQNAFEPGFRAQLMHKDLCVAVETARGHVRLETTALALQWLGELCASGGGDLDWSALGRFVQQRSLAASHGPGAALPSNERPTTAPRS